MSHDLIATLVCKVGLKEKKSVCLGWADYMRGWTAVQQVPPPYLNPIGLG
jgi:hypothetical protein